MWVALIHLSLNTTSSPGKCETRLVPTGPDIWGPSTKKVQDVLPHLYTHIVKPDNIGLRIGPGGQEARGLGGQGRDRRPGGLQARGLSEDWSHPGPGGQEARGRG